MIRLVSFGVVVVRPDFLPYSITLELLKRAGTTQSMAEKASSQVLRFGRFCVFELVQNNTKREERKEKKQKNKKN